MAASAIHAQSVPAPRIQSVDALRGAIMMLMAIDHIRDYVARSAMQFSPTDLTRTTAAIFFTGWITHFCAPVFMLPTGLGAFFWMTLAVPGYSGDLAHIPRAPPAAHDHVFPDQLPRKSRDPDHPLGYRSLHDR